MTYLLLRVFMLCRSAFPLVCALAFVLCGMESGGELFAQASTLGSVLGVSSGLVVSGLVSEAASGEAVIGVSVALVRDTAAGVPRSGNVVGGAVTNKFGFYSIPNVPIGAYFLVVWAIGYRSFARGVVLETASVRKNIALPVQNVRTQEVSIIATAAHEPSPTRSISAVQVSAEFMSKMPTLLGENDIFRVLQLLPGIKSGGELSSGLYVRGGSPDQNLVLLDGA
jgi:Carboxypeptidase regulatory-like domain